MCAERRRVFLLSRRIHATSLRMSMSYSLETRFLSVFSGSKLRLACLLSSARGIELRVGHGHVAAAVVARKGGRAGADAGGAEAAPTEVKAPGTPTARSCQKIRRFFTSLPAPGRTACRMDMAAVASAVRARVGRQGQRVGADMWRPHWAADGRAGPGRPGAAAAAAMAWNPFYQPDAGVWVGRGDAVLALTDDALEVMRARARTRPAGARGGRVRHGVILGAVI